MLRQLYIWPAVGWVTLFWATLSVVLSFLFPRRNYTHACARLWGRTLLALNGSRVEVKGEENLLKDRAQLFFCNHQSWVDIVVISACLPCSFKWISTRGVFYVPFLGWHMKRAGYISVERARRGKAARAVQEALTAIRQGHSLVIFPEGSRSPNGQLKSFKRGGFLLALRGPFPIVPLAVQGTRNILPKGSLKIGKGDVKVTIAKPIFLEGASRRELKEVMERTRSRLQSGLAGLSPEGA